LVLRLVHRFEEVQAMCPSMDGKRRVRHSTGR